MNPSYVAVSKGEGNGSKTEQSLQPRRDYRHWSKLSLGWFVGLLWLAPIIVLLYFNFTNYIIGPSASCPSGGCKADPFAASDSRWAQGLDYNDHNTLGGLQLVAKVLELWFLFVAIRVVYNITMVLASNGDGLPISLLSAPWEFADSRSLWESFRAISGNSTNAAAKSRKAYFFGAFLISMCLLVNLMGPAVAVLVLPALRWVDLPKQAQHSFNTSGIDRIMVALDWRLQLFPNCTGKDIMDRHYSCTSLPYASSLDSWVDSVTAVGHQEVSSVSESQPLGISPEGEVFFTFNASAAFLLNLFDVAWVPNRQALREVSTDVDTFYLASQDLDADPRYGAYNRSLNTVLKRRGPIFGASGHSYILEDITSIIIGHEQEIRCYDHYRVLNYGPSYGPAITYTKCLRVGTAWNSLNKQARFSAWPSQNNSLDRVEVSTFFSDQAAYFNETFNSDLIPSSCFVNGTVRASENCTFDRVFTSQAPDLLPLLSSDILYVQLSMPQKFPNRTVVFELLTFANFSTYTLDTSPQTNPMYLVQVDDIPKSETSSLQSISVDPDWLLAAWSVDNNGLVANRSASLSLVRGLEALLGPSSHGNATSEDNDEEGPSLSVSDSPLSSLPNPTSITPISTFTAEVPFAENINGTGSVPSASSTFGMMPATVSLSDSAFDIRAKREEASPTSLTTTTNDDEDDDGDGWSTPTALSPTYDEDNLRIDSYSVITSDDDTKLIESNELKTLVFFSYLQGLSMVPYSKLNLTSNSDKEGDSMHPPIWYWAKVHVWGYGLDSRTSKLGIVVTMLGAVCVIISTVIGMIWRREKRSLTDLIIAALEHRQEGEPVLAAGEEQLTARTRYKLIDDGEDKHIRFTQ